MPSHVKSVLAYKNLSDGGYGSKFVTNVTFVTILDDDILPSQISSVLREHFDAAPKLLLQYPLIMPESNKVTLSDGKYLFINVNNQTNMYHNNVRGYTYFIAAKRPSGPTLHYLFNPRGFVTYPGTLELDGELIPSEYDRTNIKFDGSGINFEVEVTRAGSNSPPFEESALFIMLLRNELFPDFDPNFSFVQAYRKDGNIFYDILGGLGNAKTLNELSERLYFDVVSETQYTLVPDVIYKKFSYTEQRHKIQVLETSVSGQILGDVSGTWEVLGPYADKVSVSNGELTIPAGTPSGSFIVEFTTYDGKKATATVYIQNDALTIDPYVNGGYTGVSGGGGNFGTIDGQPETSNPTSPDVPSGSTEQDYGATGIVSKYILSSEQLTKFGEWLWPNFGTWAGQALLSLFYGSPIESIISLMSYPFSLSALSGIRYTEKEIVWGDAGTNVNGHLLTKPYGYIDWGKISVSEYWGNFLDYAPHTKIELYLPWGTGFVELNPNECMGKLLNIVTNIELDKGTCIHNVIAGDTVIASYSGVCGKQIPITALDNSGKALTMISTAASLLTGGISYAAGTVAGAAAGNHVANFARNAGASGSAIYGARVTAERIASEPYRSIGNRAVNRSLVGSTAALRSPAKVQRNGSYTDGGSGLGIQYPYIIITRPDQSMPRAYGEHYGYPCNTLYNLGKLRGYTEVGEIHLHGFAATQEELNEIDTMLKEGVIF